MGKKKLGAWPEPTNRAIDLAGGHAALAEAVEVDRELIYYWQRTGRVSPDKVLAVEAAVQSRVTRYELRPDVYGELT